MPPWAFQYFANALTASTLPWNRPGASGEPTSAMPWIVISVGVTPTSLASSAPLHPADDAAVVVVASLVPDVPLRPHAAATRTRTTTSATKDLDVLAPMVGL